MFTVVSRGIGEAYSTRLEDGSGKTLGGSADRPADTKTQYHPADAAYVGLRVVRGEPKKKEAAPEKK